jgi:hypothetical protein
MCAPAIALFILLSFIGHHFLFAALFLFFVWVALNIRFVIFMAQEKGIRFGVFAFFLSFLDHIVMAIGILSGFFVFSVKNSK